MNPPSGSRAGGAPAPFTGTAQDYRAKSAALLQRARTAEPPAVARLEAEAAEWTKLAIEADLQDALQLALSAVDRGAAGEPPND